jgi:hypothetical protein
MAQSLVWRNRFFREQLRDFAATERQKDFDSISNVERSKLMARFFAEKILKLTNPNIDLLQVIDVSFVRSPRRTRVLFLWS